MPNSLNQTIYDNFGVKITVTSGLPSIANTVADPASPSALQSGTLNSALSLVAGYLQSSNFVTGSTGWRIDYSGNVEFNAGTFRGSLIANSIDIPDITSANSFHVDNTGNAWWGTSLATGYATAPASILKTGVVKFNSGTIGGFTLGATTITATNLTLDSGNQKISLGSGNNILILDAADATYRLAIGNATYASAPFRVDKAGAVTASNITITGGSVASSLLSGVISQANLNVANQGWTQTSVFSVGSATQVNWAAGTFTTAGGTSYSISSGNTGTMAARTYIYLDIGASTTAYQTTTTATTAVGAGKVLIATAQNNTSEAIFQVFSGLGGLNLDGSNIVPASVSTTEIAALAITTAKIAADAVTASEIATGAVGSSELAAGAVIAGKITAGTIVSADIAAGTITGSNIAATTISASNIVANTITASQIASHTITATQITAATITTNEIAANTIVANNIAAATITGAKIAASTITASNLTVSQLSAITADMGSITAGTIVLSSAGYIRSGQTDYATGTGFFLGISGAATKFSIGSSTNFLTWDGSTLSIQGTQSVSKVYTSGESITAGDAVAIGYYQSDGGPSFDFKTQNTGTVASGGTITITLPSVGSNSNRGIVVFVAMSVGSGTPGTATATYNGTSLIQGDTTTQTNSRMTSFYLLGTNVTTGAHNLVISLTGGSAGTHTYDITTYSYYNLTTTIDGHGIAVSVSGTATVNQVVTTNGSLIISSALSQSSGFTFTTTNFTNNTQTNATGIDTKSGDTGIVIPAQTVAVTASTGNPVILSTISLAPFVTATSGFVIRASAAANGLQQNRYNSFIGFAQSTVSANASVAVTISGEMTGLSGLSSAPSFYYLSNSLGQIATSVGTNTRKVGINSSTTSLLITNIW